MSDATQSPNRVLETPVLENPVLKSPVLGTPALDVSLPGFVRRVRNSDEPVAFNHGRVYAYTADKKFIITTPNMTFVPQPVCGTLAISMMPDARFGAADPTHWPQVFEQQTRYPWMAVIQRKPVRTYETRHVMWEQLRRHDFVPVQSSAVRGLGTVSATLRERLRAICEEADSFKRALFKEYGVINELNWLCTTMEHTLARLQLPATFRDMVRQHACLQRFYIYTVAWLDWYIVHLRTYRLGTSGQYERLPVDQLMGCITTSPVIAQAFFEVGAPVWYMRTLDTLSELDVLEQQVALVPPTTMLDFASDDEKATYTQLFAGLATAHMYAGDRHVDWINRQSQQYGDIERLPVVDLNYGSAIAQASSRTIPGASASTVARTQPPASASGSIARHRSHDARFHPYQAPTLKKSLLTPSERAKFQDPPHPIVPPILSIWQAALSTVELKLDVPTGPAVWKYWVPEARLLVGTAAPDRLKRYVLRWLKIRDAWYYLISRHLDYGAALQPLKAPQWRDYLNMSSLVQKDIDLAPESKRSQQIVTVLEIIAQLLGDNNPDDSVVAQWFNLNVESLDDDAWTRVLRQIAWDVAEVGFRVELTELDRYLVPRSAPGDDLERIERDALLARVFPANRGLILGQFPTAVDGLEASQLAARAAYLEALREVLCRWPGAPDDLKSCPALTSMNSALFIAKMERQIADFYCATFFRVAGRAPVLPRCLPAKIDVPASAETATTAPDPSVDASVATPIASRARAVTGDASTDAPPDTQSDAGADVRGDAGTDVPSAIQNEDGAVSLVPDKPDAAPIASLDGPGTSGVAYTRIFTDTQAQDAAVSRVPDGPDATPSVLGEASVPDGTPNPVDNEDDVILQALAG